MPDVPEDTPLVIEPGMSMEEILYVKFRLMGADHAEANEYAGYAYEAMTTTVTGEGS